MIRFKYIVLLVIFFSPGAYAQLPDVEYPGRPQYPDGLLYLRAGAGMTKYTGEFESGSADRAFQFDAAYAFVPEFALGIGAEFGTLAYIRRQKSRIYDTYKYQFNTTEPYDRTTSYSAFHIEGILNFFPRMFFNAYLLGGVGAAMYEPSDYAHNAVRVKPNREVFATLSIPVGLGVDYYLGRTLGLNLELRNYFLMADDLDAFPSQEIRNRLEGSQDQGEEGNDGWFALTLGLKYYLFENNDLDGDLLTNEEERRLGTNPYEIDTDGDGLSDYDEVYVYTTNPLKRDTDTDGLNDYLEVMTYRTDPAKPDTDSDGLSDGDEVFVYLSVPTLADTDGDGLSDYQEAMVYHTDPKRADTDEDGLSDFLEVNTYDSDPLNKDSDSDRISDYDEVFTYNTDPTNPDSDGDGVNDGEEVVIWKTNPLVVDTDGDELSDYAEIRETGTNPTNRDTDGDGIPDNVDRCPLLAGPERTHGCPDDANSAPYLAYSPPSPSEINAFYNDGLRRLDRVQLIEDARPYLVEDTKDTLRVGMLFTLFGVNFELDKDSLRVESYPILEENAKLFKLYPDLRVEIRGHTDSLAEIEYNQDLSERRAKTVKRFLVNLGVSPDQMETRGFGESVPIAPNSTDIGRAKNRRVEFFILNTGERDESFWDSFARNPETQVLIED